MPMEASLSPLSFEGLPSEILGRIIQWLSITDQVLLGRICNRRIQDIYQSHGPVSLLKQQPNLAHVVNESAEHGGFSWRQPASHNGGGELTLRITRRHPPTQHFWIHGQLPVPDERIQNGSSGVLFRFKMSHLRPNGAYCSLLLNRQIRQSDDNNGLQEGPTAETQQQQPAHLEIKFDGRSLRGYGEAIHEDFGHHLRFVRKNMWLLLLVQFDWEARYVKFFVNGVLAQIATLRHDDICGVRAICFKGYKSWGRRYLEDFAQVWSHVYVGRGNEL